MKSHPAPRARVLVSCLLLFTARSHADAAADAPPVSTYPLLDTDSRIDIPLEQLVDMPVEFVSGVSKYEQSVRRAPAGVTVFTANDIKNHGWRTLSDALRTAPGVHIRSDRFYDYIGNRGFTRPFDYNSRTLVLIDGHRLNDAIYQQGAIGTEFILDLDMVERIEIIRGPGSSVYGSNAFYGAVNVIPKRGRDLDGGQVGVSAGSEPSLKGRVSYGDRTSGGVDYTLSATEAWSQGEDDFTLPQSWRDADPALTATSVSDQDQTRHKNFFAHAAWRGFETEVAYVRRRKDVLPPVFFTNVDTPAYGIDERAYALIRATGDPAPDSTFTGKIALDYYSYEGLFSPANTNFERLSPYAGSLSLNTELRWQQTLSGRHTLVAGLEHQVNFFQNLGRDNLDTGVAEVRVRESSHYVSPFAQLDWELLASLRLSLGGRYDFYSTDEKRFTPRLGLIWEASPDTTLKLLYGESFRVPNLEERFAGEAGLVPNPDIGPETNRSWELIFERQLTSVWRLDATLHRITSDDLITTVPTNANPAVPDELTFANVQNFRTEGMDIGLGALLPLGVQLRASGTIQRTEDDATDRLVADAPRTLLKLNVSTPLGVRSLRLGGELQYVGERQDAGDLSGVARPVDDYLTANLTLRTAQLWRHWSASLSAYNIADATWSDPKNIGQISSPPRTFLVRATREF